MFSSLFNNYSWNTYNYTQSALPYSLRAATPRGINTMTLCFVCVNYMYYHTCFYTYPHTHNNQFPTLCCQFYSLLQYMCETHPKGIAGLPADMLLTLMTLLEAGLLRSD